MSPRVDTSLMDEIKAYGAVSLEACFNCGNCTAVCPLSTDRTMFPRNTIRMIQVGLRERLLASVDPWLCYYCGECSTTCPREAEPGETMMAVRRWLTGQYDRSGEGKRLYVSARAAWKSIARYALVPLVLLLLYQGFFLISGDPQIVTDRVSLNTFAPVMIVWVAVLIDFAILFLRVGRNSAGMIGHFLGGWGGVRSIPLGAYVRELKTLFSHALTQKRWIECGENKSRWFKHLLLMSGYVTMLVLVVGLLWWFQTDAIYPIWNPQRWLGYYATLVLLLFSGEALVDRWRKREELHRFSQHTDWLFPGFLFVGALTGILVHAFRYAGWPWPTYIMYVIHLMAMVAMLDSEVGIGKWTHLIYRPLAVYLQAVKDRAREMDLSPRGAVVQAT
jgi:ferredoxin